MNDPLSIWTIYWSPADHPDKYVARRWEVTSSGPSPTKDRVVSPSIDELRNLLPPGLTRLSPDQPVVVETWI